MVGLDHANDFEDALQTSPVGVLPRCTARPAGLGSVQLCKVAVRLSQWQGHNDQREDAQLGKS